MLIRTTKTTLLPYLQLARFPAVFTAISNIIAAHIIASQGDVQYANLLILVVASAFLYLGGMILNDCFDIKEDSIERPHRPLPAKTVPLINAWVLGFSFLIIGCLTPLLVNTMSFIVAIMLSILIISYNGFLKKTVFSAPAMGACRLFNWLLGISIVPLSLENAMLALPIFLYITSLTLLSRIETSANTKNMLYFTQIGLIVCALSILFIYQINHGLILWLLIAGVLYLQYVLFVTQKDFTPERIQKTVTLLLLGIIPLDALLCFASDLWLGGIIVLMLWFPGKFISRWMAIT